MLCTGSGTGGNTEALTNQSFHSFISMQFGTMNKLNVDLSQFFDKTNKKRVWMKTDLIERTSDINRAILNDLVHNLRDGLGEVRVGKLEDKQ